MTLFELVIRSMRKNIKHYYLYFFALIFSTSLYFVFTTLQHDSSILRARGSSASFSIAFQVAGILLLFIVVVFTVYANRIFLRRRSREIGLYQLIGLTKLGVARFLVIENVLLGAGALLLGIVGGAIVSRLFLLILVKLLGFEGFIAVSFSVAAARQTAIVFAALIALTSMQMVLTVYRHTLLELFNADKQGEHPRKPKIIVAAFLALAGIAFIGYGYRLSGHMINEALFFNMLTVIFSTILGTYLLFRVTIGWLFYQYRKSKGGHLGILNSMSLAPLMHRMKANANSLTIITVLSATTLTMVALASSLYYSAEKDARLRMPYDFVFTNSGKDAASFGTELEKQGIQFIHKPIEAVRLEGVIGETDNNQKNTRMVMFFSAEQLREAGADVTVPGKGEAVFYSAHMDLNRSNNIYAMKYPQNIELSRNGDTDTLKLTEFIHKYAMNYFNVSGLQLLVSEATINEIKAKTPDSPDYETVRFDTYQLQDKEELSKASGLYKTSLLKDEHVPDFYTENANSHLIFGLFIFISGFLGLAFLFSTGSILYFKQMTEAEQEKRSYTTLRQLGFEVKDIMRGIVRKQLFVFAIPLLIGLMHSVFAVKAASIFVLSDITISSGIAMSVYVLIYFVFAVLTIGYYRKIVKNAM